jgi:hypothetical protein
MRTSRFFGNASEIVISVNRGTLLVATAGSPGISRSHFAVSSAASVVEVGPNSKMRARLEGTGSEQLLSVTLDEGDAQMMSRGKTLHLKPKELGRALGSGTLEGPLPAEEELVRNGHLTDPATSGAELIENGGLGIAGWIPIRSQAVPPVTYPGVVELVSETVGAQTTNAIRLQRGNEDSQLSKIGMRQEINSPAEFLTAIEVKATVKVVAQTLAAPGPRGDLLPLTINVIFRDSNGNLHDWKHSFFVVASTADVPDATRVQLGTWTTVAELPLKSDDVAQDIQIIEAIEVYGFGRGFESWITGISLVAR